MSDVGLTRQHPVIRELSEAVTRPAPDETEWRKATVTSTDGTTGIVNITWPDGSPGQARCAVPVAPGEVVLIAHRGGAAWAVGCVSRNYAIIPVTLINGYQVPPGGYDVPEYWFDASGTVHLRGWITNPGAFGSAAFQVLGPYQNTRRVDFMCADGSGSARHIYVPAGGLVIPDTAIPAGSYVSLSACAWRAGV